MTLTLVVQESIADRLMVLACMPVETGAVLLARYADSAGGDARLLVHSIYEVPAEAYDRREPGRMEIRSEGYVPALGLGETKGMVAIWTHTHPGDGSSPWPSDLDNEVDALLTEVFRLRTGNDFYGALIFSHQGAQLTFTGHLDDGLARRRIDRLFIPGDRFSLQWNSMISKGALPALFDRNIRAFGGEIQHVLGDLRIAVVGCGGTGSAVAEQLVRLGVRHLDLFDPDVLSETNLTRVYGSTQRDVGLKKVDVLADHLSAIASDARIERVPTAITVEASARRLVPADLIFGCTDDNAGRLVLSRISTYFLKPVLDCGVILTNDGIGVLNGIFGRVTILYPGAACLVCRDRIDLNRAAVETRDPDEQASLVKEGYAPSLGGIEPAVVTFTSMVAATAVGELLERFTGYGPEPVPNEIILRIHDREISTNRKLPRERHYCHPGSEKLGLGETSSFLDQTWKL